jgi:copper resistance protein B
MRPLLAFAAVASFAATPALAQMDHSNMPGMAMPKPAPKPKPKPAAKPAPKAKPVVRAAPQAAPKAKATRTPATKPVSMPEPAAAEMDHSMMPGMTMPAKQAPSSDKPAPSAAPDAGAAMPEMQGMASGQTMPAQSDPHAGHDMGAMSADNSGESEVGDASAPAPPGDHAADAIYGAEAMAQGRKVLAYEVGGMGFSLVMVDLAEVGFQNGRETYRFEGEAFTGGNLDRFGVKLEGEGTFGQRLDDLELQAVYSRAIAPYWNLQAGVRYDIKPDPSRTYAVLGVEGIAPYWFKVTAATFLSNKGEVRARIEGSYDLRLTQKLILQPRVEANLSFQDIAEIGVGSGLSDIETGLRLRYEIKQEFAPYIGVEWRKQTGDTARLSRLAGDDPDTVSLVAGVRIWF